MNCDRLLARREVERRVGLVKSRIYELIAVGRFPRPLRIGPQSVRWRESEIAAWIETLPRGGGRAREAAE